MILKELDPFYSNGEQELAARISADRMAYYLRRYFRRSAEVDVLNGLRLRSGRSIARVDHLLLHNHGMLVVEREDVQGPVRIDDDGQWMQWNDDLLPVAMGSPITRAYVQALLLKAFLDRRVRQKGFFDQVDLDVLVVVSDTCEIEWPPTGRLVEVCRRDEVFARVSQRLVECRDKATRPGSLPASERLILGEFLSKVHIRATYKKPDG